MFVRYYPDFTEEELNLGEVEEIIQGQMVTPYGMQVQPQVLDSQFSVDLTLH